MSDDRASAGPAESVVAAVTTEHFVLQSARGSGTAEAGGRLSGLLATVSGALVATGFVAGTPAAAGFFAVAVPAVVLLGLLTYRRLVEIGVEDVQYVRAIQDIRRWYDTELPEGLPAVMTARGSMSGAPVWSLADTGTSPGWFPLMFTTASAAALITSLFVGGGVALVVQAVTRVVAVSATAAAVAAVSAFACFYVDQARRFRRTERGSGAGTAA